MKQLSRIAAAAALAAGALISLQASAATICTACSYNQASNNGGPGVTNLYVGALNSTTGDLSFVNSGTQANAAGAFSHTYVFDFAPIGSAGSNLVFLPTSEISNFTMTMFSATSGACSALVAGVGTGGCSALVLGAMIGTANNLGGFVVDLPFTGIPAGRYALRVTGTVNNNAPANSGYSGQVSTQNVPEPGSLALAGLAMVGAAFAARRARKA